MPIVNVTLPSDGTGADVGDYNPAILAILAVLNGHIASDNIEPGSLDWSVMSGTMTNVIPSTAMQDSANLEKFRDEADLAFVVSGLVWSIVSGLNCTMTSGTYYATNGTRVAVGSVASRAFTASKDTYVSISNAGVLNYQEVANNAAKPSLTAGYKWLAMVVSGASTITSITDMRQISPIAAENIVVQTRFLLVITAATNCSTTLAAVPFDTRMFDPGFNCDITTNKGRFTAPVAGIYMFYGACLVNATNGDHFYGGFRKNGAESIRFFEGNAYTSGNITYGSVAIIQLAAGDYVDMYWVGSVARAFLVGTSPQYCWFGGHLLSKIQ